MKYAADFRAEARKALRGKWLVAILTGLVASLIGASIATAGSGVNYNSNNNSTGALFQELQMTGFWLNFRTIILGAFVALVVWLIIAIIISGAGKLGYAIFNLKLVDEKNAEFKDLFSQFHRLGDGFCMNFLVGLYTLLWSLLFVIPGIIKTYSYAMTPYILAENPGMTASDAITKSRRIMDGNKWRLFCLGFSFIGWGLLCVAPTLIATGILTGIAIQTRSVLAFLWIIPLSIPTGVGMLFLHPYQEAAWAAFYRDISGTAAARDSVLPEGSLENSNI